MSYILGVFGNTGSTPVNMDANNITKSGIYFIAGPNCVNTPLASFYGMVVDFSVDTRVRFQIATDCRHSYPHVLYLRVYWQDGWSDWINSTFTR